MPGRRNRKCTSHQAASIKTARRSAGCSGLSTPPERRHGRPRRRASCRDCRGDAVTFATERTTISRLETFLKTARQASLPLLIPALLLSACGMPAPAPHAPAANQVDAVAGPKPGPVQWNGVFSCTPYIEGRLPAITMKGIPFRQEGDRITALYNFTDSFKHRNSVAFSGIMSGQSARIAVTAIRVD